RLIPCRRWLVDDLTPVTRIRVLLQLIEIRLPTNTQSRYYPLEQGAYISHICRLVDLTPARPNRHLGCIPMTKIFWSWQSDRPGRTGRFLVRDALQKAIEAILADGDLEEPARELHLDHDRKGVPGSPDLARLILDKVKLSSMFVADVTNVG